MSHRLRKNRTFSFVLKLGAAAIFIAVSLIIINTMAKTMWPSVGLHEGFVFGKDYGPIPFRSMISLWLLATWMYACLSWMIYVAVYVPLADSILKRFNRDKPIQQHRHRIDEWNSQSALEP